jgi:hypothetical protein
MNGTFVNDEFLHYEFKALRDDNPDDMRAKVGVNSWI